MSHTSNQYNLSEELVSFVFAHRFDDVRQLAFQRDKFSGIDFFSALEAIQARQKLARKFPEWAEIPGLFVPHPVMVEQASGIETANYKQRFIRKPYWKVLDMSGGLGSDSIAFSQIAESVYYLDIDEQRAMVAEHNFRALGRSNIQTAVGAAQSIGVELASSYQPHLIYIDPDRRPTDQKRVFLLEDSEPNILDLLPRLMEIVPNSEFLIKLSPLVDIEYLRKSLPFAFDVHVVGVRREAKELLIHIYPDARYALFAVEISPSNSLVICGGNYRDEIMIKDEVGQFVYDLFPSVAKIGLEQFALNYPIWQPDSHTHLYFSDELIESFPGRKFRVMEHNSGNQKWLKGITQQPLHLLTKNIPIPTDHLRKQLKIKEGGELFLIAFGTQRYKIFYVLAQIADENQL